MVVSDAAVQRVGGIGRDVCERGASEHAATVPFAGAQIEWEFSIGDGTHVEDR